MSTDPATWAAKRLDDIENRPTEQGFETVAQMEGVYRTLLTVRYLEMNEAEAWVNKVLPPIPKIWLGLQDFAVIVPRLKKARAEMQKRYFRSKAKTMKFSEGLRR